MSYKEALAWLYGTQQFGIKLGLDNIRRLIAELRVPPVGQRFVHVAGTNGKGSVAAMIAAICRAGGYRVGLFTSPHLVTFRERIQIDGEMIPQSAVAEGLSLIRALTADWQPSPTFFEIATALALRYFAGAKAGLVVLETGMGGRLDATNAVQPVVSVITPIALDHQKWLGDTIGQIAHEKAGIIKPSVPVVSSAQQTDAERVLRQRAAECGSPIEFVADAYDEQRVSLAGAHQRQNAALAIAAVHAACIVVGDLAIAHGLSSVDWPARFQLWDERTVIDGAHNPAGATVLAQTWRERFGNERAALVFGVLHDKQAAEIYRPLIDMADAVFLPRFRGERAMRPDELAGIVASLSDRPIAICNSCAEAIQKARATNHPVLITGSLHLAGEVLAFLRGEPAAFEECAQ